MTHQQPPPDQAQRDRITAALAELDRCFIGAVHAFCSRPGGSTCTPS